MGSAGPAWPYTAGAATLLASRSQGRRPFALLGVGEAEGLLDAGGLGEGLGERRAELAEALAAVINRAILQIRASLLEAGYAADDLPLAGDARAASAASRAVSAGAGGWWASSLAHPNVWRLAITGGPCAGKTSGMARLRKELRARSGGRYLVFVLPEVATILFNLGVMNHGTFDGFEAAEYRTFAIQASFLQVALEEIWAQGADAAVKATPNTERAVLLCDRDAMDIKAFSRPADPSQTVAWQEVVRGFGELVGRPGLTQADIVRRYQLGLLLLQSFAVVRGKLNAKGYNTHCIGQNSSNSVRRETAEAAKRNDEIVRRAYSQAYPAARICFVSNSGEGMAAKMDAAAECVWQQTQRLESASAD